MSHAYQLSEGLKKIHCDLNDEMQARLLEFINLLAKWNRIYNLTAIRQKEGMIARHLLDSLVTLKYIKGIRVLDVGTGAGLPGIPLAIARPETDFVLLDSNSKKTRFITQAIAELKLSNVKVVHARVEDYKPEALFNTVITRAFADTKMFVELAGSLCTKDGQFLLMQGESSGTDLPEGFELKEKIKLEVPGAINARYLTIVTPVLL